MLGQNDIKLQFQGSKLSNILGLKAHNSYFENKLVFSLIESNVLKSLRGQSNEPKIKLLTISELVPDNANRFKVTLEIQATQFNQANKNFIVVTTNSKSFPFYKSELKHEGFHRINLDLPTFWEPEGRYRLYLIDDVNKSLREYEYTTFSVNKPKPAIRSFAVDAPVKSIVKKEMQPQQTRYPDLFSTLKHTRFNSSALREKVTEGMIRLLTAMESLEQDTTLMRDIDMTTKKFTETIVANSSQLLNDKAYYLKRGDEISVAAKVLGHCTTEVFYLESKLRKIPEMHNILVKRAEERLFAQLIGQMIMSPNSEYTHLLEKIINGFIIKIQLAERSGMLTP